MNTSTHYPSDVAFTPTVKAIQARRGSRESYARMEESGSWQTRITPALREFIDTQSSVFLATANSAGQPYIQHRGGPPGFLRVLDERTIAFADFRGNRQYISTGNLVENPKAHLFLISYETRQRIKLWGEARVVEADAALIARLMPADYKARADQAIMFTVTTWDANCPQHIPRRVDAAAAAEAISTRDERIAALEEELRRLKAYPGGAAQRAPG